MNLLSRKIRCRAAWIIPVWVISTLWIPRCPAHAQPGDPPPEIQTGRFSVTFTERSELSSYPAIADRLAMKPPPTPEEYEIERETFEVYVPPDYQPDQSYGVLVWINAIDHGRPFDHYQPALSEHRLIWVGANRSGNNQDVLRRLGLALDGAHNITRRYTIDPERVYVAGFSGGGRCASMLAPGYAEIFSGGYYLLGCNKPIGKISKRAKDDSRYVHLSSDGDFNLENTRNVHAFYVNTKFRHAALIELTGLGHDLPDAEGFEKGIIALDQPLRDSAQGCYGDAVKLEKRKKFGDAWALYTKAARWGGEQDFVPDSVTRSQAIVQEYDQQFQIARRAVIDRKYATAKAVLARLKRQYTRLAEKDVEQLQEQIRAQRKTKQDPELKWPR